MINLDEKYFITSDTVQYMLRKRTDTIKKNGEELTLVVGYYTTLPNCIKAYIRIMEKERLDGKKIHRLSEFILWSKLLEDRIEEKYKGGI